MDNKWGATASPAPVTADSYFGSMIKSPQNAKQRPRRNSRETPPSEKRSPLRLSAGKVAPSLNVSTDKQIYTAMLSGPESMPVFSDNQLTPTEKRQIIAYVQTLKASKDPGGSGIDRIGPVSEAIVIWAVGVGGLMIAILWIGARVR